MIRMKKTKREIKSKRNIKKQKTKLHPEVSKWFYCYNLKSTNLKLIPFTSQLRIGFPFINLILMKNNTPPPEEAAKYKD